MIRYCENQFCGKILELRKRQKRLNPNRRFCDHTCQTRENANKNNFNRRNDKKYKKRKKIWMKNWYGKNKERQFKNVMNNYYNNKSIWNERKYVDSHKKKIWEIIGNVCVDCGKKATEVNHKKYNFPKRTKGMGGGSKLKEKYLIDYCKFLEAICMPCHRKRKIGRYKPK